MATKDDRPTLLSKMAMFVRNPTKDWSELDRPQQEEESGYDKQALKAMIERKRQNDFVRRREFDQLRKLRSRDASAVAALGRPSVFQSSVATDPDGRAVTLKKIDEIEAQMSKQWWKGKQEAGGQPGAGFPVASRPITPMTKAELPSERSQSSISLLSDHFQPTGAPALPSGHQEGDFLATEMGAGMNPAPIPSSAAGGRRATPGAGARVESYAAASVGFSTSGLFALDVNEMATDPELEEAAIRFANGDDAGAEKGLLEALRGAQVEPEVGLSWVAALLDLYRATHNRTAFVKAAQEFSVFLDGGPPHWVSIGDSTAVPEVAEPVLAEPEPADALIWDSPADLTAPAMEELREALGSNPMPWHLGWSRIRSIAADAMPLLGGLFSSLCNEPVALRFSGQDRLVQALRAMMPSGDRSVDPAWWAVRLDVFRTMHMQDEFEMLALDYCVTYEVSPPPWQDARCSFERSPSDQALGGAGESGKQGAGFTSMPTAPMALEGGVASKLELRGQVVGDATQALADLDGVGHNKGDRILVSCQGLLRVDFSAAGSILNWVALRQAEGCHVQFRDVHRLVAAFFNVIGINEHAQVVPRPI